MNDTSRFRRRLPRAALLLGALALAGAAQAADVGVSIQISQPGVYGRIDLGRYPQPAVVVGQPVLIAPPRAMAPPPPVYLWVPPGHQRDWRRHCHRYNACGVPVYFVQDRWYRSNVMPPPRHAEPRGGYRNDRPGERPGDHYGERHGERYGERHGERHGERDGDERRGPPGRGPGYRD